MTASTCAEYRNWSIGVTGPIRYPPSISVRASRARVAGLHDTAIIEGVQEDEYRQRIREGWRVVEVRPICRSLTPKLIHTNPDLQHARVYSYVLVILEHPARKRAEAERERAAALR